MDNFLAGEDTPSNSVGALAVSVGPQITLLVDSIVGDPGVSLNSPNQRRKQVGRDKELEIGL